jgi:hypothetical protein
LCHYPTLHDKGSGGGTRRQANQQLTSRQST